MMNVRWDTLITPSVSWHLNSSLGLAPQRVHCLQVSELRTHGSNALYCHMSQSKPPRRTASSSSNVSRSNRSNISRILPVKGISSSRFGQFALPVMLRCNEFFTLAFGKPWHHDGWSGKPSYFAGPIVANCLVSCRHLDKWRFGFFGVYSTAIETAPFE